jgi:hypothetical protein
MDKTHIWKAFYVIKMDWDNKYFWVQISLATLHAALAAGSYYLAVAYKDTSFVPVTLPAITRTAIGEDVQFFDMPIYILIGVFSLITVIAHLIYSFRQNLSVTFRWIEYSLSASIMMVIINLLCGVQDFYTLILVFGAMHITMPFGYLADYFEMKPSSTDHERVLSVVFFFLGFTPFVFSWLPVICQFSRFRDMPLFVTLIFYLMLFLFLLFPVVQWLCVFEFKVSERKYDYCMHVLSLVAKATLTLLVMGGTLNII